MLLSGLSQALHLSEIELLITLAAVFIAGLVRGFSGFGMTALIVASLSLFLEPKELIAVAYFLEMAASLLLVRGGWALADRKIAVTLLIGNWVGYPFGIALTNALAPDASRFAALSIIMGLTLLQLARVRPPSIDSLPMRAGAGIGAGLASGLAGVGGLVVALYTLISDREPKVMRATMVLYLALSIFTGWIFLYFGGWLTEVTLKRAAILLPITVLGVLGGAGLFRPALQPFYRTFCLILLLGLSLLGLGRLL